MADSKREVERKYEATDATRLPDLGRVAGVGSVAHEGVMELDAVYYDTEDLRLAAAKVTLRRRTGGSDAGWHLKLPVAPDVRDEIRAPLSETVPTASPPSSAPGSSTPPWSPWSGCSPPATSTCSPAPTARPWPS